MFQCIKAKSVKDGKLQKKAETAKTINYRIGDFAGWLLFCTFAQKLIWKS